MRSNRAEFDRRMRERLKRIPELVAARHREIAVRAHAIAVELSPVDEGDYRDDWNLSVGAPDGTDNPVRGAQASLSAEAGDIAEVAPFSSIFLSNANPAAPGIEHGWSDQAPQGVLSTTAMRLKDELRRRG